ncbi:MAG: hypothetical protein U1F51_16185 [Burkholderiales bacterium]
MQHRVFAGALAACTVLAVTTAIAQNPPPPAAAPAPTSSTPAPTPSAAEPAPSSGAAAATSPAGGATAGDPAAKGGTPARRTGDRAKTGASAIPGLPPVGGAPTTSTTKPKGADASRAAADGAKGKGKAEYPRRGNLQSIYADVMNDAEKKAFREKVRKVKTYDECKSLLEATHQTMEPRAKAKGGTLPETPTEACDKAKARGRVSG